MPDWSAPGVVDSERRTGSRRGVVLGAGGVLGAAWTVGALAALEEEVGLDPRQADVIVGTSAGSVVAALLAHGVPVKDLLAHQRGVAPQGGPLAGVSFDYDTGVGGALPPRPRLGVGSSRMLVQGARHPRRIRPLALLSAALPTGSGSLAGLAAVLDQVVLPGGGWPEAPSLRIVAMDYDTGTRTVFGAPGSPAVTVTQAVLASCAVPGWFAPVRLAGRRYVDAGPVSATSLDLVADLRLDEVYALSPMVSRAVDRPASLLAKAERRWRRHVTTRVLRDAELVRAGGARLTLLGPEPDDLAAFGANLMDPRRRRDVLETSLLSTRAALRLLREGELAG